MTFIKYISVFSLAMFLGYILTEYYISLYKNGNVKVPYYVYVEDADESDYVDTNCNIYKDNGEWIPLYQQYRRGVCFKVVDNARLASKISEAILISNLSPKYIQNSSKFRIYSINNDLWAVYEEKTDKLLLLFQQKDCKMLYIAHV